MPEKPVKQERRYLSYLLRLWREGGGSLQGGAPVWRAFLERPQHGDRLGFATLSDLFAFLEKETGSGLPGSESGTGQERESGGVR
jgi:hypothetical protein